MKQLLLLLFLILTSWLKAQYDITSDKLTPFKDYRSCLTGLKDMYGSIVVKAEYDVVEPLYSLIDYQHHITGWVVKKAAGCGILSAEGEVQIPAIYETMVRWNSDTMIVGLNGKKGMINRKNEWLIPAKYDQLYSYSHSCLFYELGGKKGIINKALQELTLAVYDQIESAASYSSMRDGYVPPPNIFKSETAGKYGIIDLRKGELIPPVYDHIDVVWVEEYCPDTEANYIVFKDSLQGVIRSDGHWGVALTEGEISIHSHLNQYCGNRSAHMALITKKSDKQVVCNLQTGKMSAEYTVIQALQTRAIGWKGNRWFVLDTNFTELYSSGKLFFDRYNFSRNGEDYWVHKQLNANSFGNRSIHESYQSKLNWDDDVLYVAQIAERNDNGEFRLSDKQGLLNYVTGKTIPMKYDAIHLREMDGKTWYWAYEFSSEDLDKNYTVTIYDASMKRGKTWQIEKTLHTEKQFRINGNVCPDLFRDQKGKWGAIDISGKVLVPFQYSKCYLVWRKAWNHKEADFFFACGEEGKMGVYNNQGNLIVPGSYDTICLLSNGVLELKNDNVIDLISVDGSSIAANCSDARIAPGLSVNGSLNPIQNAHVLTDTSQQSVYYVKDNQLYYYSDRVTRKCDASFFQFESDTLLVSYTYEIDKTGTIRQIYDPYNLMRNRAVEAMFANKYQEVRFFSTAAPSFYWYSVADKKWGSVWHVLDSLKRPMFDYDFEYPTLGSNRGYHIFRVKGKYGAFSGDYKILLLPEYDYIHYNSGVFFVRKDDKWQLFDLKKKVFSEPFEQISTERYTNGRFVFQGEQIGFIDTNYQLILPMQPVENLIQNTDLAAFCKKQWNNFEEGQLLNLPSCKEEARIRNNQFVVDKNIKKSTDNQMLAIEERPYYWEKGTVMPMMHFTFNEESFSVYRTIQRSDQKLLSFYTDNSVVYSYDDNRSVLLKRDCSNFRIVNKQLVPVKLNDLLKQDEVSKEKFRELFLKELNASQFAGLDCPDIEVLLQGAQDQFDLYKYGLHIYLYKYTKITELSFSYGQLKDILRQPSEFGL